MEICIPYHLEVGAGASDAEYVPLYRKLTLKDAKIVANKPLTAHDSNYYTFSLVNGSTTLASRKTQVADGSMAEGVSETMSLSGGEGLDFSDLGELKINCAHAGSSSEPVDLTFLLVFEPRRET